VPLHIWNEIEIEQMNPLVTRQVIHSERMTISRLVLKKGAAVSRHQHENEQITMLESGRLRFIFDDEHVIVEAGHAMQIAPNRPHAVEALEDSVACDLFAPVRADWISGDDAYLRR
jgi:quercetin dioxygenase-like cupin family protein